MKTNGTRIIYFTIVLQLALLVLSFSSKATPSLIFSNGVLISGTNNQLGAVYRFSNVRSNTDALVTISGFTGGVTLDNIDGASGFVEALQPVFSVPAHSKGYVEFTIQFVKAGTTQPKNIGQVPVTMIDIDGQAYSSGKLFEFDQVYYGSNSYYVDFNMLGGQLNVTFPGNGWVTATNTVAVDYSGVDTVAKAAMFTVVENSVTSLVIRTGADNQSNATQQRLSSAYFQDFTYVNSFLSQPALLTFRGNEKDKKVELQWEMTTDTKINNVIIEKATTAGQFEPIGQIWLNANGNLKNDFNFTDNTTLNGQAYYRLKMVQPNGSIQYSNILAFRAIEQNATSFKVYPTAIHSSVTVNVRSEKAGTAVFQLVDYAGRVLNQQVIGVQQGDNNVVVNNLGGVNSGNYIAMLRMDNNTMYNQKVIKQ